MEALALFFKVKTKSIDFILFLKTLKKLVCFQQHKCTWNKKKDKKSLKKFELTIEMVNQILLKELDLLLDFLQL